MPQGDSGRAGGLPMSSPIQQHSPRRHVLIGRPPTTNKSGQHKPSRSPNSERRPCESTRHGVGCGCHDSEPTSGGRPLVSSQATSARSNARAVARRRAWSTRYARGTGVPTLPCSTGARRAARDALDWTPEGGAPCRSAPTYLSVPPSPAATSVPPVMTPVVPARAPVPVVPIGPAVAVVAAGPVVSRGDRVRLHFHGRRSDVDDLRRGGFLARDDSADERSRGDSREGESTRATTSGKRLGTHGTSNPRHEPRATV
jgi:hypothetical protein